MVSFCNKIQIQENIECCKEHIKLVENLNSKTKVCTKDIIKIVRKHVWKTFTYFNRAFCKPKIYQTFLKIYLNLYISSWIPTVAYILKVRHLLKVDNRKARETPWIYSLRSYISFSVFFICLMTPIDFTNGQ